MVNPGAFHGLRKEFLLSLKNDYELGLQAGHAKDAIAIIQRKYHKRFPITLPHDEEPSQAHLDSVDDDAPDDELEEPDADVLTANAYKAALEDHESKAKLIAYRNAQIKRWFAYQYLKDHDLDPCDSGAENPFFILLCQLNGTSASRPKVVIGRNLWRKTAAVEIEKETSARAKATNANRRTGLAGIRAKVSKELYDQLPRAEREEWETMAKDDHDDAVRTWEKRLKDGPSTAPQDQQRCIEALVRFVQPILDGICKATGWKATLITGGPEPVKGGKLSILSIHSGTTRGNIKMNFGRAEHVRYSKFITPIYASFLKKCYSIEECKEQALPEGEGFIGLLGHADDTPDVNVSDVGFPSSTPKDHTPQHEDAAAVESQSERAATPLPQTASQFSTPRGSPPASPMSPIQTLPPHARPGSLSPIPMDMSPPVSPAPSPPASPAPSPPPSPAPSPPPSPAPSPPPSPAPSPPPSPAPSAPPSPAPSPAPSPTGLPPSPPILVPALKPPPTILLEIQNPFTDTPPSHARRHPSNNTNIIGNPSSVNGLNANGKRILATPKNMSSVDENESTGDGVIRESRQPNTPTGADQPPSKRLRAANKKPANSQPSTQPIPSSTIVGPSIPTSAPKWFLEWSEVFKSASKNIGPKKESMGGEWDILVKEWVLFEVENGFKERGRLSSAQRPDMIQVWIKNARRTTFRPAIANVLGAQQQYKSWWDNLQPQWRKSGDGAVVSRRVEGDWSPLHLPGLNGLFSVVTALFFIGLVSFSKGRTRIPWVFAVEDLTAAIRGIRASSVTPNSSSNP